jgi:hypothetical protein
MTQNRVNSAQNLLQFLSTSTTTASTFSTAIPLDNTIPQNTEGTELLTLTITPKLSTSKLLIEFNAQMNVDGTNANYTLSALFQDSTANALAAISYRQVKENVLRYVMTSGTTSSTTFKIRVGPNSAAGTINVNANASGVRFLGGVSYAWLTIKEFRA